MEPKRILFLVEDGFEDSELLCPRYRFQEEGYFVDIGAPDWGEKRGKHGYSISANLTLDEIEVDAFDALFIPGGKAPERLMKHEKALLIVKGFYEKKRPIFAICHGPLLLAEAGILKGKRATCYHKVAEMLEERGVIYENEPVVQDGNIITSREPGDIPQFMKAVIGFLGS